MNQDWTARRILKELCGTSQRRSILAAFWREAEPDTKNMVIAALARNLNFRLDSIKKATPERKGELLGMQLHIAQFEEPMEIALMLYHTGQAKELLGAFLDSWKIPHVDGSIEVEEYPIPTAAAVARSSARLKDRFPEADIALYLATAGLLMGRDEPKWREATWPEVERIRTQVTLSAPKPDASGRKKKTAGKKSKVTGT